MATGAEVTGEAAVSVPTVDSSPNTETENVNANNTNAESVPRGGAKDSDAKSEFKIQDIVEMLTHLELNPLAKEFFPSSYLHDRNYDQFAAYKISSADDTKHLGNDEFSNNRRRRNNYNQGRRRFNGRAFRVQSEDSIRQTVYVSEIDQNVTEEQLAALFSSKYGQVVDCRICGDPHLIAEFVVILIRVFALHLWSSLMSSEDEREMCARTVYCTNIDKQISQADVKFFFEYSCGEVSRLRLLGDNLHSTCIAFVEFAMAESAIAALNCSGRLLGTRPIRVSPSKTPVRLRSPCPAIHYPFAGA